MIKYPRRDAEATQNAVLLSEGSEIVSLLLALRPKIRFGAEEAAEGRF